MISSTFEELLKDPVYASTVVEAIDFFKTQIKVCASAGDMYLYEQILPLSEYPIIPVIYNHTGTPYPVGAVLPMIGKQREINKAHQIMLHNANLASNLRWLYTEGSVDEEEWEKYSSSPGALLKYRQGFELASDYGYYDLEKLWISKLKKVTLKMFLLCPTKFSKMPGDFLWRFFIKVYL